MSRIVEALTRLARAGIPTDIQELLISGDPMRGIPPGALEKALPPPVVAIPMTPSRRFYDDPVVQFRAMAEAVYPSETIDGAHFRMWCAIAADEIEAVRRALQQQEGSR